MRERERGRKRGRGDREAEGEREGEGGERERESRGKGGKREREREARGRGDQGGDFYAAARGTSGGDGARHEFSGAARLDFPPAPCAARALVPETRVLPAA